MLLPVVMLDGVDADLDAGLGHVLRDPDAALEALEAAVHMGHADMLGDEADRRVRRVEEPGAGDREFELPGRLEPDAPRGGTDVPDDVEGLAVRFRPSATMSRL